jgi:hypothetical protein
MTITRQQLVSILVELPRLLHEAEAGLWQAEQEKIKIARQLAIRKAQLGMEIAMEIGEDGKRKYSTQETREHVLELRIADDEHYQKLSDEYEKACVREEQERCELSYQRYRLKVAELLTQLLTAGEDHHENSLVQKDRGEFRRGDRQEDRQASRAEGRRPSFGRAMS